MCCRTMVGVWGGGIITSCKGLSESSRYEGREKGSLGLVWAAKGRQR